MSRVNPVWIKEMRKAIIEYPYKIDIILSYNAAAQWLIAELSREEIPYKLFQLGAGVKRITTKPGDIERCPCCKKKLKEG